MNCAKPWIMLLLATGMAQGGEIVLFDAAKTRPALSWPH
jgi:hypothetical protein